MKTKQKIDIEEILQIAKEMTCNDFLLEFGELVIIHDAENLLDMNEGMVNFGILQTALCILYIDGQFDSYSF
jgi:hypothetical protein